MTRKSIQKCIYQCYKKVNFMLSKNSKVKIISFLAVNVRKYTVIKIEI